MSDPERVHSELQDSTREEIAQEATRPDLVHAALSDVCIDDRYQIESTIGEGGMGTVYKAKHLLLNRLVAVKVLSWDSCRSPKAAMRFQQEGKAATTLSHEHIASVREFGVTKEGLPFLAMDYIDGLNLAELLKAGPLDPQRAIDIFMQVCDAMSHAHKRGILHRDLKPANILLTVEDKRQDFVKIVDFGIAKILPGADEVATNLTQTGELFGTPLYMSPEQCQGQKVDARTDIYAMGCVMYEALVGEPPFTAQTSAAMILKHISETPKPFSNQDSSSKKLLEALENVVLRCLEKDPDHRYQTMEQLRDALNLVHKGGRPELGMSRSTRRKGNLLRFGFVCAIVISLLFLCPLLLSPRSCHIVRKTFHSDPWDKVYAEAKIHMGFNQYGLAEPLLKSARDQAEAGHADEIDRYFIHYDLGNVYVQTGQYALALAEYKIAVPLCNALQSPCDKANTLEMLASCKYSIHVKQYGFDRSNDALKDYKDGIDLAKEALKLKLGAVGPDHDYVSYTLDKLADLYTASGDYKNAVATWLRAIKIEEGSPTTTSRAALALKSLAYTLIYEGKQAEAKSYFDQAIAMSKNIYGADSAEVKQLQQESRNRFHVR